MRCYEAIIRIIASLMLLVILTVIIHLFSSVDQQGDMISENCAAVNSSQKIIALITPTYERPSQVADLTRMAQTLALSKQTIEWIIVEDRENTSRLVEEIVTRFRGKYSSLGNIVHLIGPRPIEHRDWRSGKGVSNRLVGLDYIRIRYGTQDDSEKVLKTHKLLWNRAVFEQIHRSRFLSSQEGVSSSINEPPEGVIYFADDDNTYDVRLFDELARVENIGVWPVGLIADFGLSSPVVYLDEIHNTSGSGMSKPKVIGFHDPFICARKWPLDMAGFAVSIELILAKPNLTMPYIAGYEEDQFLVNLNVSIEMLECLANNCTQVLVWHTRTEQGSSPSYSNIKQGQFGLDDVLKVTNLGALYESVIGSKIPMQNI